MDVLKKEDFEVEKFGGKAKFFTLKNKCGQIAQFSNYGARWLSFYTTDKWGNTDDVVLGFDTLEAYIHSKEKYHGAIIGRVAGRIQQGRFSLNDKIFELQANDIFGYPRKNHLHGGDEGFSFKFWNAALKLNAAGEEVVEFTHKVNDMEDGYPGNIQVSVSYTLTNNKELVISYAASTDKATILNLSNHAYFNLSPQFKQTINNTVMQIPATRYIESDDQLIPTGRVVEIDGTALDFSIPAVIGSRKSVNVKGALMKNQGYALCYVFDNSKLIDWRATIEDAASGRKLEVFSDQPCLQFYDGWLMDGTDIGKNDIQYKSCAGLALETMQYPDAPNQKNFPSIELGADQQYQTTTIYRFDIL